MTAAATNRRHRLAAGPPRRREGGGREGERGVLHGDNLAARGGQDVGGRHQLAAAAGAGRRRTAVGIGAWRVVVLCVCVSAAAAVRVGGGGEARVEPGTQQDSSVRMFFLSQGSIKFCLHHKTIVLADFNYFFLNDLLQKQCSMLQNSESFIGETCSKTVRLSSEKHVPKEWDLH